MSAPWLCVFNDSNGTESCLGSVVAIHPATRAIWIATADHCLNDIASVRVGRSTYAVSGTSSLFARRRGTDFMLVLLFVPRDKPLPTLAPVQVGAGDPDQAIVRRASKVTPLPVRPSTQDEILTFDEGCGGPDCTRCRLRLTLEQPAQSRIQNRDSGGPVLSGGRLAGVISTETLDDTGIASYCPTVLPACEPDDPHCWDHAGFDIEISLFAELRRLRAISQVPI